MKMSQLSLRKAVLANSSVYKTSRIRLASMILSNKYQMTSPKLSSMRIKKRGKI